ncbi:MurR/RpiR family transcriptional regulator [Mesoplasma seiffertii]|uniref:MurR/RpiR family transcriptional regulator n=1 Tax=Mesoplasma seiffertii TaxID=28224 RepID=UPI00047B7D04|nr:MurR/RpiR family transcriptional regulator [Mesoplasma seiffertii]
MNSVLDSLFSILTSQKNTVSKAIAEELIKSYELKKIPNIKDLANSCFVAQSSITKFAKNFGYSGYRELQTKLKMEIHDRKDICISSMTNADDYFQKLEQLIVDTILAFSVYKKHIQDAAEKVLKAEKIFIFSSYVLFNEAQNLYDALLLNSKNVTYSQTMLHNLKIYKQISEKDYVFFLVAGQDTKTLEFIYNSLNINQISHCVILSHSKSFKFVNTKNKIVMDSPFLPHGPEVRKILLNYIIYQFAMQLK